MAACYANPSLALQELGWAAALGLDRMCECEPAPRERARGEEGLTGLPEAVGPCIPMWTLTTHLALSQVKTYGAGRSRTLPALAHRPDTLLPGTEQEKTNECSLQHLAGARGPRACPTSNPSQARPAAGMRPRFQ